MDVRRLLKDTYRAALEAVSPDHLLGPHLTGPRPDFMLAFGKAQVVAMRTGLAVVIQIAGSVLAAQALMAE